MLRPWAVPLVLLLGLCVADASAQENDFRVLAGRSPAGSIDGEGTFTGGDARFNAPTGIAVNSAGTIYVADSQNYVISAITPVGAVSTFAGQAGAIGNINGTGGDARFSTPQGAAVDSAGNVYIADTFNHKIRKITPAGIVTTLAGGGISGFSSGFSNGTGTAALFNSPRGIAVDSAGVVYVGDTNNHTIRKITAGGVVTTLAGVPGSPGAEDTITPPARFNQPRGIAVDGAGVLYVADTNNHTIRRISAGGVVTTLAGLAGTAAFANGNGGPGGAARFSGPRGVAVNSAGTTVYVADTNNNRIRQIDVATAPVAVTTPAGLGPAGGFDGTGTTVVRFNAPEGVAVDGAGVVYVADTVSDTIRKISPAGVVTTLAGFYGSLGWDDGPRSAARFAQPFGVAVDASGSIYVADRVNHTIRKVTRAGDVTTFAGLANSVGSTNATGSNARFNAPESVAVDNAGTVYVADTNNHLIRKITAGGVVTTLAGVALSPGAEDTITPPARFNQPRGIAVDSAGVVYVADSNNHTIRKITPDGVVTTLAGLAGNPGNTNDTGSAARFNQPRGVAVDSAGNLYVADTNNHTIRKIAPGAVVTTFAGVPGTPGSGDTNNNPPARFNGPRGIAVNAAGTVYVADTNNSTIRQISAGGVVTTIAGCPGCIGSANWGRFNTPQGLAVNAQGYLYVADTRNNTIRTTAPLESSLVVDFGAQYGIWVRHDTTWSQLHPFTAEAILRIPSGDHDAVVVDFGPGIGLWVWEKEYDGDEGWFQLDSRSPTKMVGVDTDGDGEVDSGVFDFAGQGVWMYDGEHDVWTQIHGLNASQLAAADVNGDGNDDVILDFPGFGLWVRYSTGAWAQLHPFDVTAIVTADLDGNGVGDVVVNFPGYGVWAYRNGTNWAPIHGFAATRLAAGDLDGNGVSDLVIDFGAAYGVWTLKNGTTWGQLHGLTTEGITTGDLDGNGHDDVILDFGALGVWANDDVGGWQQLHGFNAKGITTGRFF